MKIIQYFKLIIQFVQLPTEYKNSVVTVVHSYTKLLNHQGLDYEEID